MIFKLIFFLFASANFLSVEGRVQITIKEARVFNQNFPKVELQTRLGKIVGLKEKTGDFNNLTNVFFGVPYAVPPVGKLRFKRTKLIDRLPQDPYLATEFRPHCAQHAQFIGSRYNPNDTFSEDCLHLNLFTPDLEKVKINGECKRTFRVIIHIPGYTNSIAMSLPFLDRFGRGNLALSGNLFASVHETIVVTLNYRFGLFGTLVLEDNFKGNLGLFDQNLAIRWVKENIKDYCGDGKNLTLVDSTFTGLHVISPHSKNLIKNAIIQSGSPLFHNDQPATRDEIIISSFLAINDLNCVDLRSSKIDDQLRKLGGRAQRRFAQILSLRHLVRDNRVLAFALKREILRTNRLRNEQNGRSQIEPETLELIRYLSRLAVDLRCLQDLPAEELVNVDPLYIERTWSTYYDSDFLDDKTVAEYKKHNKLNINPGLNLLIGTVQTQRCAKTLKYTWRYPTDQFNAPRIPKQDAVKIIRNETIIFRNNKNLNKVLADIYTDETRWQLPRGYFDSVQNLLDDQDVNCPVHLYSRAAASSGAKSVNHYLITQKATKHYIELSELNTYDLNDYAWLGPCETDELLYIFGAPFRIPNQFTEVDRSFSMKITEIWAYLANNDRMPALQPSEKQWPSSNRRNPIPRYVEINERYTREIDAEQKTRCEIWRKLLPLYKR